VAPGDSAALIEKNLDLAHKAERLIFPRVRAHVELDELVSLAMTGLAEAGASYDPSRGVPFRSFAWYRVHGAVMDGLRRATHLPRRVWAKLVALQAAADYLENQGERAAAARSAGANVTRADALAQIRGALSAIRTMYVVSLGPVLENEQEPAADQESPIEGIDRARLTARLARAIEALPERERALVKKHYWEGKNLLEAGAELGISKSWASRVHAQAVERMRDALERDRGDPDDG